MGVEKVGRSRVTNDIASGPDVIGCRSPQLKAYTCLVRSQLHLIGIVYRLIWQKAVHNKSSVQHCVGLSGTQSRRRRCVKYSRECYQNGAHRSRSRRYSLKKPFCDPSDFHVWLGMAPPPPKRVRSAEARSRCGQARLEACACFVIRFVGLSLQHSTSLNYVLKSFQKYCISGIKWLASKCLFHL